MRSHTLYLMLGFSMAICTCLSGHTEQQAARAAAGTFGSRHRQNLETTKYYFGSVKYFSPEGVSKGETISLVKRIVSPANSRITEIVLQPSRIHGQPPTEFVTTLSRIGKSNIFSVTDDAGGVTGQLTFTGEDWKWDRWSYEMEIRKSDKVRGEAALSANGLETRKSLFRSEKQYLSIVEDLKTIDEIEYQRRRKELLTR